MCRKLLFRISCVGVFVLVVGSTVADAALFMYRVDSGHPNTPGSKRIVRCNLDGTNETVLLDDNSLPGFLDPADLWITGGKMYFGTNGDDKMYRADLDASNVEVLSSSNTDVRALAVDEGAGKIYWSNGAGGVAGDGTLERANLDGSGQETLISGMSFPVAIEVDPAGGMLYWGMNNTAIGDKISRASLTDLDGSAYASLVSAGKVEDVIASVIQPSGLDIHDGKLYYTDQQTAIGVANLDGTDDTTLITLTNLVQAMNTKVFFGKLYWPQVYQDEFVKRANLDGTEAEELYTLPLVTNPMAVFVVPEPSCFLLGAVGLLFCGLSRGIRRR